ncbi:MAG: hypothetical protein J6D19_09475 [Clostridia bacterium]|nr:hypothetical protein [Clostridia bacterium]
MKKILCLMLCAVMLLSLCACGEDDPVEITFDADLTLDVLETLLLEKGDALLATDIPENYTYVFQNVGVVPQIIYPIDDTMSFTILPITDGKNMLVLSVKTGETTTLDYVGAVDILEFIDSQKNS